MFADRLPISGPHQTDGKHTLLKLSRSAEVDPDTLSVTLFRDGDGQACGWFIGPLSTVGGRPTVPYLPPSEATHAAVAVVRAVQVGQSVGCPVCVVDPDDLWDKVWGV